MRGGTGGDLRAIVIHRPWPCQQLDPCWGPVEVLSAAEASYCFSLVLVSVEWVDLQGEVREPRAFVSWDLG